MLSKDRLVAISGLLFVALVVMFAGRSGSDASASAPPAQEPLGLCAAVEGAFDNERRFGVSETYGQSLGARPLDAMSNANSVVGLFEEPADDARIAPWAVTAGVTRPENGGGRGVRFDFLLDDQRSPAGIAAGLRRCVFETLGPGGLERPAEAVLTASGDRAVFQLHPAAGLGEARRGACRFMVVELGEIGVESQSWRLLEEIAPELVWSEEARARWRWSYRVIFECAPDAPEPSVTNT